MTNKMLTDAEERMKKALEGCRRELAGIRSGKASPALLDTVRVEAYGSEVPLNQVGGVSAPEPRLLVVQPWDKSLLKAITRAIQLAELGLNPTDDGAVVRVPIPTLTEERRRDMVKLISKFAEEGRVHIRQVRHDVNKDIKASEHGQDRKSTRLNSSHVEISYAVFCLKKKKNTNNPNTLNKTTAERR